MRFDLADVSSWIAVGSRPPDDRLDQFSKETFERPIIIAPTEIWPFLNVKDAETYSPAHVNEDLMIRAAQRTDDSVQVRLMIPWRN